jgi:type II secretory pathway component PulK
MRSLPGYRFVGSFAAGCSLGRRRQPGVVLILTLLVLIVLAAITYQITVKLSDRRRADDYLIYYQGARYACDSALKYALATTQIIEPNYADRANSPDFSDMFRMTDAQVSEMLAAWAEQMNDPNRNGDGEASTGAQDAGGEAFRSFLSSQLPANGPNDHNNTDFMKSAIDALQSSSVVDVNEFTVPGPYGPPWPLVVEPIEFEIGSAKVSITIEDENAKLPLVWMTMTDPELKSEKQEVLRVFCSWYDIDKKDVAEFQKNLDQVAQIKPFAVSLAPVVITKPAPVVAPPVPPTPITPDTRGVHKPATQPVPPPPSGPAARSSLSDYADYAKLMASSYIDAGWLTVPVIESSSRQEYPMKYLAIWGSTQVNINSAPRHVLEAAFAFGGDGDKIAEAIIEQRRQKPFKSIDDFRRANLAFSSQIQKTEKYITTTSEFFTIRITATNGPAKCTATVAVLKQGPKAKPITAVFE